MVGGVFLGLLTTAALLAIFGGYIVGASVVADRFERRTSDTNH